MHGATIKVSHPFAHESCRAMLQLRVVWDSRCSIL